MSIEEVFLKYIKGRRCTREEYLILQEYLKNASEEIKSLYDSFMKFIAKSLVDNKLKSHSHFLAAANKHGLTEAEALLIIQEYSIDRGNSRK